MRAALLLVFVCAVAVLARKPCDGKGPCSHSSSHKRSSSSSHSKQVEVFKAKVSHSTSSDHPAQCKFECPACRAADGHSSFFIGKDVIIDTVDGVIEPENKECRCKHGTQYSYRAINPKYDFGAIRDTPNLIVGHLRCPRQEDFCLETADGQLYHGKAGQDVDLQPVPYTTPMGKTRTFMTVAPRTWTIGNFPTDPTVAAAQNLWGIWLQDDAISENYAYEALNENGVPTRRLNFAEYFFVPIIGMDCGGCRKPIRYCDKAIRNTYARK